MTYATESGHKIWSLQCQSLYRSGSLKTVTGGLTKYKLDLVGLQKVKWDGVVLKQQIINFFVQMGILIMS
jgi:hypothetical protein